MSLPPHSEFGSSIHGSLTGGVPTTRSERAKVPLAPGRSLYDWMRASEKLPGTRAASAEQLPLIPMDEVVLHNTPEDAWTVFRDVVLDITPYMEFHPGGVEQLMRAAGRDMTSLFMEVHSWVNISMVKNCIVGRIDKRTLSGTTSPSPMMMVGPGGAAGGVPGGAMSVPTNLKCTLVSFARVSPDTVLLTFVPGSAPSNVTMPPPSMGNNKDEEDEKKAKVKKDSGGVISLGTVKLVEPSGSTKTSLRGGGSSSGNHAEEKEFRCGLGQHISLRATVNGRIVTRPYTPIGDDPKRLEILVKLYDDGVMTSYLKSLKIGADIGRTTAAGDFTRFYDTHVTHGSVNKLCLVAAGTGIAPFARLWRATLKRPSSNKQVKLVTVNRKKCDALMVDEIETVRDAHRETGRFDAVHYVTRDDIDAEDEIADSNAESGSEAWARSKAVWKKGHFDAAAAKEDFPPPGDDTLVCVCGPILMVKATVRELLSVGFKASMIYEFV